MISKPHGYRSGMTDHLCCLMQAIVNTHPINNPHTNKMMENQIIQLQKFLTLKFKQCVDHARPQEVIVVEINKDLLSPLHWVKHHLAFKDFSLASPANYLGSYQSLSQMKHWK